ncbi:MAG TPA: hypothetical protein PKE55_05110 [Kiritimatiellia bacterium]|nr:hypothetical protein [Kiritimatiellia bacterium]
MKNHDLLVCGWMAALGALFSGATQGAYWHEDFDGLPMGSITNQAGWESLGGAMDAGAARISEGLAYSGVRSLYLAPVGLTIQRRLAIYTNFTYRYAVDQDRILRVSANVFRENLGQYVSLVVGTNASGGLRLENDLSGGMTLNGVSAGMPWPTGVWTRIVIWHDMVQQRTALDVDGLSRIAWTSGVAQVTACDQVRVQRTKLLSIDTGGIYVDDLSVEMIPQHTAAWWRLEETSGSRLEEWTGWAHTAPAPGAGVPWRQPFFADYRPAGPVDLYRNTGCMIGLVVTNVPVRAPRNPVFSWTLEWFYRAGEGHTNTHDLLLMQGAPIDCHINLQWRHSTLNQIYLELSLKAEDSPGGAQELGIPLTNLRDDRWHHVAVVKSGSQLITYRDYRPVHTNDLDSRAVGAYRFGAASKISIGKGFEGKLMHPDYVVDELRYTEAALSPDRFIRPGGPVITSYNPNLSAIHQGLGFSGNPHRRMEIQLTENMEDWFTVLTVDPTQMHTSANNVPKALAGPFVVYRILDRPIP